MPLLFAETYPLALANALLNAVATVLLVAGYVLIRSRRETAHKRVMLTAFGVSVVFLVVYLWHHALHGSVSFQGTGTARYGYLGLLLTHVVMAAMVPFLAVWTISLGLQNDRPRHRRWAKITFPIWLYVSVTGVIVYLLNYVLFPQP